MAKTRKSSKKKNKNKTKVLTYTVWTLSALVVILASLLAGYYLGYQKAENKCAKQQQHEKAKRLELLKKLEKSAHVVQEHKNVSQRLKEVLLASHEVEKLPPKNQPEITLPHKESKQPVSHTQTQNKKGMLAIIIDDVSTRSQVRAIKHVGIPLTMSFFPPSKTRPNSAKLAAQESFYMVHLPMEAINFHAEEPLTLRVNDSQYDILQRIKQVKQLFPKVHYINNHTGSKFTSDKLAMQHLLYALNKYDIRFIDSRTTSHTKAPEIAKNLGVKYISRDIFLDHYSDKAYIKNQIKKAVALAKRRGHAIAIGHPHRTTLQALYESRDILNEVNLVQINRIY